MFKLLCCLSIVLMLVSTRFVPFSPCPDLFNYYEGPNYEIYGGMKFKNDWSGEYKIEVNMSIALETNRNIYILRMTSERDIKSGFDIIYYVRFPFNHTLPILTSLTFNEKLFCTGPSEIPTKDHGITALSATEYFNTTVYSGILPTVSSSTADLMPPPTPPTVYTTPPTIDSTSPKISNRLPGALVTECGLAEDTQALVVNGNPTRSGEYPWLTAIFYQEESGEYKFRCAGNLVTKRHVISAAHCFQYYKASIVTKESLVLVLGKHNIKTWAVRSVIRDVKTVYVHPDFNAPGDADLAILNMYQPVEFSFTVRPICLWSEDDRLDLVVRSEGTVAGWGRDENENDFVPEPRQLTMPIVSQEDCLRSDDRFLKLTSNRTFCAGSRNGSAPCSGDSGGGFVVRRNGRWILRGIVSVALVDSKTHTCDVNNYVVFSDAAKYSTWISSVLRKAA